MRAYRDNTLDKWPHGLNTADTPAKKTEYEVGTNIRLTETNIPEKRPGTAKKNTGAAISAKPVINAMKYYPTGRTAQWVALADETGGANSDVFFSADGLTYTAQSLSLTAGAEGVFAVFPESGEDHLFVVNGPESKKYDPSTTTWTDILGSSPTGCTYICTHGDRLWLFKDDTAYYSDVLDNSWDQTSNYLTFSHRGESITRGISFNDDLIVFRQNSIGVLRGKDPVSGVQVNALVDEMGTTAPKSVVEGRYRGRKVLYFVNTEGHLAVFDGFNAKVIDKRVDLSALIASGYIAQTASGLYDNRYLVVSYASGTVNDSTVVYDTEEDRFIATDTGYYARCLFSLDGPGDNNELHFGTSNDLGLIYTYASGTQDGSPVADGTDVNVTSTFTTSETASGDPMRQTRLRRLAITCDNSADIEIPVDVTVNDQAGKATHTFTDYRESPKWGTVANGGSGYKWGTIAAGGSGKKWGTGTIRKTYNWNLPQGVDAYSYKVKLTNSQNKTLRLFGIAVAERPRTAN